MGCPTAHLNHYARWEMGGLALVAKPKSPPGLLTITPDEPSRAEPGSWAMAIYTVENISSTFTIKYIYFLTNRTVVYMFVQGFPQISRTDTLKPLQRGSIYAYKLQWTVWKSRNATAWLILLKILSPVFCHNQNKKTAPRSSKKKTQRRYSIRTRISSHEKKLPIMLMVPGYL